MAQQITTNFRDPATAELQNRRFVGVVAPGIYAGYRVSVNAGSTNLLDISIGSDTVSVLITTSGQRVTENTTVSAAAAVAAPTAGLDRFDLVVAEFIPGATEQEYKVIQGRNQLIATIEPVQPTIANENQVPLAYVRVRGQLQVGGQSLARIEQSDILHIPQANWQTSESLNNLKPVIETSDPRLLYVYPGSIPTPDGGSVQEYAGGYSAAIEPTLTEGAEKWYLFGLTSAGIITAFGSADAKEDLPELTNDVYAVARARVKQVNDRIELQELEDIRLQLSRNLVPKNEADAYKTSLNSSVLKYLRVEEFYTDPIVSVTGGTAVVDTTDNSLALTSDGADLEFVTDDMLLGGAVPVLTHILIQADTTIQNLKYQYSTTSATAGFSATHTMGELVTVPNTQASRLFLKFIAPAGEIITTGKLHSFGIFMNLGGSQNSLSITELGLDNANKGTNNLLVNGDFYHWEKNTSDGKRPVLTEDTLEFPLNELSPLGPSGWQLTKADVPFVGEVGTRVKINDTFGFQVVTQGSSTTNSSHIEQRIPAYLVQGSHITFCVEYFQETAAAVSIGIAQFRQTSAGPIVKHKTEQVLTKTSGTACVQTDISIGTDISEVAFFIRYHDAGSESLATVYRARAAIGLYAMLPYTMSYRDHREYHERGRFFVSGSLQESATLGGALQFGKKKLSIGTLTTQTLEGANTNRSGNIQDVVYSTTVDGMIVSASAATTAETLIDVDWESFVTYQGTIEL